MLRVIVTRHGETHWNQQRRNQGHTNIPLSEQGIYQAEKLADYLQKSYAVDHVYTSPLLRAYETAKCCAQKQGDIPLEMDERLYDIHFGDWQGLTSEAIVAQFPEEYKKWDKDPFHTAIPGATESFQDVCERVLSFMQEIYQQDNKTILIVTHQIIAKVILADALQLPLEFVHNFKVENCSINLIRVYQEKRILYKLNELPYEKKHYSEGDIW